MTKNKNDKFNKFLDLLYESDHELVSSDDSLQRFDENLQSLLSKSKKKQKHSWIYRAKKQREEFKEKVGGSIKELIDSFGSREALVEAIKSGSLGSSPQHAFQVHFRNRKVDEMSEEDLKLILGDQKILELLEEFENGDSD